MYVILKWECMFFEIIFFFISNDDGNFFGIDLGLLYGFW